MYPTTIMSSAFVCMFCGTANAETWGWVDLCDRGCFHDMLALSNSYEDGIVDVPDKKIVDYFTKNPDPGHAFQTTKTLAYIAVKAKEAEAEAKEAKD